MSASPTYNMLGPIANAGGTVTGLSGTVYAVSATGFIVGVLAADVVSLQVAGYNIALLPANIQTQFGGSAANAAMSSFTEEGNLYRNIGNPIASNAADTTDDIIGGIVLPASVFDILGRGVYVCAQGKTAANGNNKQMKLWIAPTMAGQTVTNGVISGGTVTGAGSGLLAVASGVTTLNAKGWGLYGNLFKYGAAGSNTQMFQGNSVLDTTHGGIQAPAFMTLTESATIAIVVTGSSSTTGAAADVLLNFLEINAMN